MPFKKIYRLAGRYQRVGETMKDDQLAAARGIVRQAAACRIVDDRVEALIHQGHVAAEIEASPVPLRAEHPFKQAAEGRLIVDRLLQEGPAECIGHFAAR